MLYEVITGRDQHAVPVAFLNGNVLAERLDEVVARLRREAAELDRRAVTADGLHPQRLLLGSYNFV